MAAAAQARMEGQWKPKHNQWAIALTVTMATFMEVLDTSIANVALPHIAGGLSASQDEATWVLTSYLVSNAIVLPISGWLATRIGRKNFYMLCVALFTISSFLCGLAPSLGVLILCRVLQGAGGGGLAPSEQAILADTFPPAKRGIAFAVYGMAVVLAPAIGPTLGGFITDNYSWRWIFYINIPVGALSLFLTHRLVEDPPYLQRMRKMAIKVDYIGLALVALGLGALQVVLDKGQEDDWFGSHFITGMFTVAAIGIVTFIVWELFQEHPIVDLTLFKNRSYAVANLMMFMVGVTLFGSTVLLPQFLQTLLGYTAQKAGETLSLGGFAILGMMPLVGMLVRKVQARYLIGFGFLISAVALFHMTNLNLGVDFHTASMWRVYQALGLAFLFVPINTVAYVGVPQEKNNQVSGMVNLMRNIGGSVGISMVTTILARRAQHHHDILAANVSSYNSSLNNMVTGLTSRFTQGGSNPFAAGRMAYGRISGLVQQQSMALAYIDVIWIFAVICTIMTPLVFVMKRNDPGSGGAMAH